ncbi:MAG TPA: hypothetical protein VF952_19630 [Chloroflexia bacterium]|jgi:hypothetical protein
MSVTHTQLGSCFLGNGQAYIYILYSRNQRALYVGQTSDQSGVVGRLCAHISQGGTLRTRLYDHGVDLNDVDDLTVFAYRLPDDPRYTGIDRAYREGVEYLVQKGLRLDTGALRPALVIVSNVTYNEAATQVSIQNTAQLVLEAFKTSYAALGA